MISRRALLPRLAALAALIALPLRAAPAADAQRRDPREGSGAIVKEFLAALDRGDVDGALARCVANVEVELADGTLHRDPAAVRGYLAAFPRPVEVRDTLPWGGRRFEARVTAGGVPLLLTFQGSDGAIAYLFVEPDPTVPPSG
jgi:hypothetical protein